MSADLTHCPHCGSYLPAFDWVPTELKSRDFRLIDTLELAVPMWLDLLEAMGEAERDRHIWWWTKTAVDEISAKGDNLMFGHKKATKAERAEIANTFNYLASALAAAAYCPGGVSFAGRHWCTAPWNAHAEVDA